MLKGCGLWPVASGAVAAAQEPKRPRGQEAKRPALANARPVACGLWQVGAGQEAKRHRGQEAKSLQRAGGSVALAKLGTRY